MHYVLLIKRNGQTNKSLRYGHLIKSLSKKVMQIYLQKDFILRNTFFDFLSYTNYRIIYFFLFVLALTNQRSTIHHLLVQVQVQDSDNNY